MNKFFPVKSREAALSPGSPVSHRRDGKSRCMLHANKDAGEIPFVENEDKSLIYRYIFYILCIAAVSLLLGEVMSPKILLLLLLLVVTRACLVLLVMGSRKK